VWQLKAEHVRTLVDAKAGHSEIITASRHVAASSFDLGTSTLRRAHKCHLEYLTNMGVTASIAVAIIVRDKLWGLIVAHHWTPKFCSYQMRMAGDFLAQAFSMSITALLDGENHSQHRSTLDLHAKLCDQMTSQGLNPGLRLRALVTNTPSLLDLVPGVCGAAVIYGGKVAVVGTVPSPDVLATISQAIDTHWLTLGGGIGRETHSWERMSALLPDAPLSCDLAGVLAIPVAENGQMLLFRPELSTTIRWAGDPKKYALREQMTGALHPRASFEIYADSVRGQSKAWHKRHLDAAAGLGLLVNDMAFTGESGEVDQTGGDVGMGMRLVIGLHILYSLYIHYYS